MTALSVDNIGIVGCILAGGLSTRMQGPEKTLMPLGGSAMILRVSNRLAHQVNRIVLNANGDPGRFAGFGLPVQADTIEGFAGPLAGVHAGMTWASENAQDATHILTVAGDTPFFPVDLRENLLAALLLDRRDVHRTIAMAYSDGNRHPTFGLWPISLKDELELFLRGGDRKVMLFAQRYNLQKVGFPLSEIGGETIDPFFNVNTPDEFAHAERLLALGAADPERAKA